MKIKYNAPVTLTFALTAIIVLALNYLLFPALIKNCFTVPSHNTFNPAEIPQYFLLVSHIIGHADWNHLLSNLAFILLLGPLLEETYGSIMLAVMMLMTALVTGVLNVCFSNQALMGASGIAFMMILLSSFTNTKRNELPLTFVLIVLLYVVKDISLAFQTDNISQLSHLAGGLCGSLFGYFRPQVKRTPRTTTKKQEPDKTNGN